MGGWEDGNDDKVKGMGRQGRKVKGVRGGGRKGRAEERAECLRAESR
jgi:hypothetical protein